MCTAVFEGQSTRFFCKWTQIHMQTRWIDSCCYKLRRLCSLLYLRRRISPLPHESRQHSRQKWSYSYLRISQYPTERDPEEAVNASTAIDLLLGPRMVRSTLLCFALPFIAAQRGVCRCKTTPKKRAKNPRFGAECLHCSCVIAPCHGVQEKSYLGAVPFVGSTSSVYALDRHPSLRQDARDRPSKHPASRRHARVDDSSLSPRE